MQLFGSWLHQTRELQKSAYDTDPPLLRGEEWRAYMRWNTLAAQVELGEAIQEVPWKPWAVDLEPTQEELLKFAKEQVDVLHFIGNMLCAAGVTDDVLSNLYLEKMRINEARQATGTYTGRNG